MNEYKKLLKQFSDHPITINDIENNGFDINSKEFVTSFQWLESEQLITPLSESTCGLRLYDNGSPLWVPVELVITKKGKDYLDPPKLESDKLKNWLFKPLIVAIITSLVSGAIGFYIGKKLQQNKLCQQISHPQKKLPKPHELIQNTSNP